MRLLQVIAEVPGADLCAGLERLKAAEFVYETERLPDIEYKFKHALTHEVAYRSLLQARRRALHVRIVEAVEAAAADRLAELWHQAPGRPVSEYGGLMSR